MYISLQYNNTNTWVYFSLYSTFLFSLNTEVISQKEWISLHTKQCTTVWKKNPALKHKAWTAPHHNVEMQPLGRWCPICSLQKVMNTFTFSFLRDTCGRKPDSQSIDWCIFYHAKTSFYTSANFASVDQLSSQFCQHTHRTLNLILFPLFPCCDVHWSHYLKNCHLHKH